MSDTKHRKKTKPRSPYKGEDMVDTITKVHVPKNKPNRKTDKQKHIKEELSNYDDN